MKGHRWSLTLGLFSLNIVSLAFRALMITLLGANACFVPTKFEASLLMSLLCLAGAAISYMTAAQICVTMDRSVDALRQFVSVAIGIELSYAVFQFFRPTTNRWPEVSSLDAAVRLINPLWVNLLIPIIGFATVHYLADNFVPPAKSEPIE